MPHYEAEDLADLVIKWRTDIVLFVNQQFNVHPTEQQERILKEFVKPSARVAAKSGHGIGKTTVLAWILLWVMTCFDDVKVPCTSPTAHQLVDLLWPEVKKWQKKMLEPWCDDVTVTKDKIKLNGTENYSVARTGRKDNPEALQGFHSTNLVFLIDEASGIPDIVFTVAEGALTTEGSRVLMTGNPTRTNGYFYRAFNRDKDKWTCLTFSSEDSPNVSQKFIDGMREGFGEDSDVYRVRVQGEFPHGGDLQFISMGDVSEAMGRYYTENVFNSAPAVLGFDVAEYGGDRSVLFLRKGLYSEILWTGQGKDNLEVYEQASLIVGFKKQYNAQLVFVDAIGTGVGVVSALKQMGVTPVSVKFSNKSFSEAYLNKRAECWGLMKQWIKDGGWLPDNQDLKTDLCAPDYQYALKGKIQIESKDSMRRRGLKSTDLADALALTFAMPVVSSDSSSYSSEDDNGRANLEFDMYTSFGASEKKSYRWGN